MPNQQIKCNVNSCKFNDHSHKCGLSDITVGNCEPQDAHFRDETECDSFEAE